MAEDRSEQYLKVIKDGKVIAVGEKGTKEANVTGLTPATKYSKGTYKKAFDTTTDQNLSEIASELVDVEEFTTLPISVTGVTLDKTTLSLDTGKTGQLTASVAPTDATNKAVSWSSDTTTVATVDNTGKVTAVKAGTAKITVKTTDGSKTAVCTVTVKDPVINVTGVTLDKTALSLEEGATGQLTATVSPSNASDKSITWKSADESIATVDDSGKVTAVKAGSVDVTATTKDGNKAAKCAVTVTAKAGE